MSTTGVMTTVGVVVASTEGAQLIKGHGLTMRPVVAGFILGIGLFAIEAANADLASKLGVLIIVTALILNGGALFKLLGAAPNAAKA